MTQIRGGVPNDLTLEKRLDGIGASLSIALSQAGDSAAVWTFVIYVQYHSQGNVQLGRFSALPPTAGDPPSRIVGFANCPGAKGWAVQATTTTLTEIAECNIDSSDCCSGPFGVTVNNSQGAAAVADQFLNVDTIATMAALVGISAGVWAWVRSVKRAFEFEPGQALVADGLSIVQGVGGQWNEVV
jgi:hypothetical protein